MYITNFVCTYKLHDDEVQEDMYRMQILQAFHLTSWDDDQINKETDRLYDLCNKTERFSELLDKLKKSTELQFIISIMGENDNVVLFKCLFRFELFDIAHKYISNIIENKPYDKIFMELLDIIK
jgi:hypothetical protein